MGRLSSLAVQMTRLEQAFLQDNVQAFRHELRRSLALMEDIPGDTLPVRDEQQHLGELDGPEAWL